MATNPSAPDRDLLHRLVNLLPSKEVPGALKYLRERAVGHDPLLQALADAPEDDEPLTPEEAAEIQEGLDAIARGDVVSHDEVRRSLGL